MTINEIRKKIEAANDYNLYTDNIVGELDRLEDLIKNILPGLNGVFCRPDGSAEDNVDKLYLETVGAVITKRQVNELSAFAGS